MVVERGKVWWAHLDEPAGSGPGYRRPVLIVQADSFNRSRIPTVIVVVLTSNFTLLDAPGNVLISKRESGLPKDSTANISQIVTLDRQYLGERARKLPRRVMAAVDGGLKVALNLE